MNKRIALIGIGFAIGLGAHAEMLNPDEALDRLYQSGAQKLAPLFDRTPVLKQTVLANNGEPALYLFSNNSDRGFMLLSADDCVTPLLGYADSGSFDSENLAPGFKYWMEALSRQISYIKSSNVKLESFNEDAAGLPDWSPIEPLIKSNWDQGAPYNDLCPEIGGIKCYTGCVATSMAQVMRYYQYPEHGQGIISYRPASVGKNVFIDLDNTIFDYENMIDTYVSGNYTSEQATAVATLMKAVGFSVQMNYTTSVSGALSAYIPGALVNYFKYDPSIAYYDRSDYDYDEWSAMIYEELQNKRPVIYDGTAPFAGGHSFICDGYDGNGYFHINWGWNGMSDGYFLLDALSPSAIGIGGFAGGFIFDQDAVLGIKPYEGGVAVNQEQINQYGALFGRLNGNTLELGLQDSYPYLGWGYIGITGGVFDFGAIIEPENGDESPQYYPYTLLKNQTLETGIVISYIEGMIYNPKIVLDNLELTDGVKYKVTMATKDVTGSNEWIPVISYNGYPNYVYITRNGEEYDLENIPSANFNASGLEFNSTLYYGCPAKVHVSVVNNTDVQLSHPLSVILVDRNNTIRFLGDSFYLTLNPGESIEKDWVSNFILNEGNAVTSPTEFTAYLYDQESGVYIDTEGVPVTMQANPGNPVIFATLLVPNAEKNGNAYIIEDPRNIPVQVNLNVSRGYFAYPVSIYLMEQRGNYLYNIISTSFDGVPFLNSGEGAMLETVIDFANPDPNKTYYLQAGYAINGTINWLLTTQTALDLLSAGVSSVDEESEDIMIIQDPVSKTLNIIAPQGYETIKGYSLNGMQLPLDIVENGNGALIDLSNLGKGIVLINVVDNKGNNKTVKVAL